MRYVLVLKIKNFVKIKAKLFMIKKIWQSYPSVVWIIIKKPIYMK